MIYRNLEPDRWQDAADYLAGNDAELSARRNESRRGAFAEAGVEVR